MLQSARPEENKDLITPRDSDQPKVEEEYPEVVVEQDYPEVVAVEEETPSLQLNFDQPETKNSETPNDTPVNKEETKEAEPLTDH